MGRPGARISTPRTKFTLRLLPILPGIFILRETGRTQILMIGLCAKQCPEEPIGRFSTRSPTETYPKMGTSRRVQLQLRSTRRETYWWQVNLKRVGSSAQQTAGLMELTKVGSSGSTRSPAASGIQPTFSRIPQTRQVRQIRMQSQRRQLSPLMAARLWLVTGRLSQVNGAGWCGNGLQSGGRRGC